MIRPEAVGLEQKTARFPFCLRGPRRHLSWPLFSNPGQVQNLDLRASSCPPPLSVGQSVTLYLDMAKILFLPD